MEKDVGVIQIGLHLRALPHGNIALQVADGNQGSDRRIGNSHGLRMRHRKTNRDSLGSEQVPQLL
jgi:hypothetical protein